MWVLCLVVLRYSVAIVPKSKCEMVAVLQLYCFYAPVVDWLRSYVFSLWCSWLITILKTLSFSLSLDYLRPSQQVFKLQSCRVKQRIKCIAQWHKTQLLWLPELTHWLLINMILSRWPNRAGGWTSIGKSTYCVTSSPSSISEWWKGQL